MTFCHMGPHDPPVVAELDSLRARLASLTEAKDAQQQVVGSRSDELQRMGACVSCVWMHERERGLRATLVILYWVFPLLSHLAHAIIPIYTIHSQRTVVSFHPVYLLNVACEHISLHLSLSLSLSLSLALFFLCVFVYAQPRRRPRWPNSTRSHIAS